MRLLTAMLLFGLTGSAIADEAKVPDPKPARLGLRVVKVMPESHQALLFDKNRGTHVLVEVGKTIDGFTVQDIDDEEVVLGAFGASVVLSAPGTDQTWRRVREGHEALGIVTAKPDPYGPPPPVAAAPVDPYADVRTAEAPRVIDAGEGGVRVVTPTGAAPQPIVTGGLRIDPAVATAVSAAPATATAVTAVPAMAPATDATAASVVTAAPATAVTAAAATAAPPTAGEGPADPYGPPPAPTTAPTPATATATDAAPAPAPAPAIVPAPAAAAELATTLGRAEVDRALLDFGRLSTSAKGAFTPAGLRLDKLVESSLYFKAGLRAGDVVTAVDGKPLHSIDDAADLYARSTGVKAAIVSVIRDGKPMTLRVTIQ